MSKMPKFDWTRTAMPSSLLLYPEEFRVNPTNYMSHFSNLNQLAFTPIYMKYSRPVGISMVEKPPLHTYDIVRSGGSWRPFYLSFITY